MTPIHILVVEDNPADVRLLKEALKASRITCALSTVDDGEAALDFIFQRGAYATAQAVDLVLLDLNLPKKNGLEVLAIVKADPVRRSIQVVVLTTSENDEDVVKSYALHANCYIRKPPKLEDFIRVVRSIDDFWLTIVRLPTNVETPRP
jgi:CheY-like chemotaxis protein